MNNKEIRIFDQVQDLVEFSVQCFQKIAGDAVSRRGMFTVALSGGSTPVILYEKLALTAFPWEKTHIFLVDERFVPVDHKDSNLQMINETLLTKINIPEKHIHSIPTGKSSADESANLYERDMRSFFNIAPGKVPGFDLVLLGLGADGHTASLFPGSPALTVNSKLAVAALPPEKSMHERITLTFTVINKARNIMFLITGKSKAEVVRELLENNACVLPAANVRPEHGKMYYLLDNESAAQLTER